MPSSYVYVYIHYKISNTHNISACTAITNVWHETLVLSAIENSLAIRWTANVVGDSSAVSTSKLLGGITKFPKVFLFAYLADISLKKINTNTNRLFDARYLSDNKDVRSSTHAGIP